MKTVATIILDTIRAAGVKHVYGLAGDSLSGFTDAMPDRGDIEFVGMRHEEAAAFAAGTNAAISEGLGVCMGSCGAGSAHLLNGLFNCHRAGVPVLAIAVQVPGNEIGSGYYQETHPERFFRECSYYCEVIAIPEQAVRVTEAAIQSALGRRGVGVIVLPIDVAPRLVAAPAPRVLGLGHHSAIVPASDKLTQAAELLNDCDKVTILAGAGIEGAHAQLLQAAQVLQAPVVHIPRGKECVEPNNPFAVGQAGPLGLPAGSQALLDADAVLLLSADFLHHQFFPENARVVQVDRHAERLGRHVRVEVGLHGTVETTLLKLLPLLRARTSNEHLRTAQRQHLADQQQLAEQATGEAGAVRLRPQHVARLLDELVAEDAIFTCDVGTPTRWATHYLRMNGRRRLLGSFNHGSMAAALPQAIGAALAAPGRQVVALCGDGSLAMLLGELLTLRQTGLPIKIILFNNSDFGSAAHGQPASGAPGTDAPPARPDFAQLAEAVGIRGFRVGDPARLEEVLRAALAHAGPVVVDALVTGEGTEAGPHLDARAPQAGAAAPEKVA